MKGFCDIHNHMLYRLDDGAKSYEITYSMLELAYKEGTRVICFTPHYRPGSYVAPVVKVNARFESFLKNIGNSFPKMTFCVGNEIMYHQDIIASLNTGKCRTLNNSRYVLIEFDTNELLHTIKEGVNNLVSNGYRPLIAHIERYRSLTKSQKDIDELISRGALMQVNASSVVGSSGIGAFLFTRKQLKLKKIAVVASDAHDTEVYKPGLMRCAAKLSRSFGKSYAEKLMIRNPIAILNDQII